ncbi:hypothetical protein KEJ39_01205 [Candidatus Bathyarchaeota archaeon]|nr:hypothetical protein [Candidatus Bathyarchaeota archaeon]
MTAKVLIKQEKCTGCRTCEIVCSYHLSRAFQPSISKIQIVWDSERSKMHITMDQCDLCEGEEAPLCVRYCSPKALVYQPAAN